MNATYNKVNAKSVSHVPGRLLVTNKKLHFLSASGGADIPLKRILRVERKSNGVYLELSIKKGNGFYIVDDPMIAEAVIDTLVRMDKRQLLAPQSDAASRHIPHDVRQAVWQRDQGKCVQCSAIEYLEIDHIIPFGKGGASTVNNVELLCRKCNLVKEIRL
jgi:5-methylcytosine-specific restriction endonuclease McrA